MSSGDSSSLPSATGSMSRRGSISGAGAQPSPEVAALYAQLSKEMQAYQQQVQQSMAAQMQQQQQALIHHLQTLSLQQPPSQPSPVSASSPPPPAASSAPTDAALASLAAVMSLSLFGLPDMKGFDGTGGAAAIEEWRECCQRRFDITGERWGDSDRVKFAASHLKGHASQWWQALPVAKRATTFEDMMAALRKYFVSVTALQEARQEVMNMKQGRLPLLEYCTRFRGAASRLAQAGGGATDNAELQGMLVHFFANGLTKRELASKVLHKQSATLDDAVDVVQKRDLSDSLNRIVTGGAGASSAGGPGGAAPMDLNAAVTANGGDEDGGDRGDERLRQLERLCDQQAEILAAFSTRNERGYGKLRYEPTPDVSKDEIRRRRDNGLCYGCGDANHVKRDCPKATAGGRGGSSSSATGGAGGGAGRGFGRGAGRGPRQGK